MPAASPYFAFPKPPYGLPPPPAFPLPLDSPAQSGHRPVVHPLAAGGGAGAWPMPAQLLEARPLLPNTVRPLEGAGVGGSSSLSGGVPGGGNASAASGMQLSNSVLSLTGMEALHMPARGRQDQVVADGLASAEGAAAGTLSAFGSPLLRGQLGPAGAADVAGLSALEAEEELGHALGPGFGFDFDLAF
jgi:hypothetical protein